MFLHITINMFSNGRNEWNMEFLLTFFCKISVTYFSEFFSNFTKFFLQIYISKKWGFTKWDREEYEGMRESGKFFEHFFFKIFREINGVFLLIFRKIGPRWRQCEIHARPWTFVCLVQDSSWIGWFVRKNFVKSQSFLWNSLTLWRE